jgi:lipopolysaccharide export system permease protein
VKTLDRYIIAEMAVPFLVGFLVCVLMLVGNLLFYTISILIQKGVPMSVVLRWLATNLPYWSYLAIPVAILLSSALVMNRLTRENEVTSMRIAGASLRRILRPVLLAALVASIVTFAIGETLVPIGNAKARELYSRILIAQALPSIQSNVFFSAERYYVHLGSVRKKGDTYVLKDIVFYGPGTDTQFPMLITAKRGTTTGLVWHLLDGMTNELNKDGELTRQIRFKEARFDLERDIEEYLGTQQKTEQEMSMRELAQRIKDLEQAKMDPRSLKVAFWSKTSIPFACVVFALIASPLSFAFARGGNFSGLLLAVVVLFFYYVMMIMGQALGRLGIMPPFLAAWLENILFAGIGIVLIARFE